MYFLAWIGIGLITGWLTGKLLAQGGYAPIVNLAMAAAGAITGGSVMRFASSLEHSGLMYTSVAAILGAGLVAGINSYFGVRKRLA
jgi:uncharacterized membrane protein YeaQ/YmgE (transglycosylase-associated protein family)